MGEKFPPAEVLEFWRTFKGSKAQRTTLFFKGFQISLIKIGSPPTISRLKRDDNQIKELNNMAG